MKKIGVLASGGGTNLQAIIDSCINKELDAAVCVVICNKADAYALKRAEINNIPHYLIQQKDFQTQNQFTVAITDLLIKHKADFVVFAGFLQILTEEIVKKFPKRIINIHPSLIPKHCGKGYWGIKVHESVIASGEEISGVTVHFADEGCDTGEIILQKTIAVEKDDTAQTLQKKVLGIEHKALIEALQFLCRN